MGFNRHHNISKLGGFFVLCLVLLLPVQADDQFVCCMRGIKSIRNIQVCPAPCCEGYEEKMVFPAKLVRIAYCVKDPKYKQDKSRDQYKQYDFV